MAYKQIVQEHEGLEFRQVLYKIRKQLTESDVEDMRFFISGLKNKPGYAELEEAKKPIAFLKVLVKYGLISEDDCSFLEYLLNEIGQIGLITQLKEELEKIKGMLL